MTTTATAAVLRGADGEFGLEEVELGPLAPDELLVRVAGVGLCHTDLLVRDPEAFKQIGPVILGHEGAGVVEAVGDAVQGVTVGSHVVLSFDACGRCASCLAGQPSYCTEFMLRNLSGRRADLTTAAVDRDGQPLASRWFGQSSFASHAIATARNVVAVDQSLPLEILGPLGCGLQTGAGAVINQMQLGAGQSLAVFGAGAVGLSAVMAARASGAGEIVAVDRHDSRLAIAQELGATRTVRADAPDLAGAVRNGGPGVDFVLDTTAVGPVMAAAIAVLGPRGQAVLVGGGPGLLEIPPVALAGKTVTYGLEGSAVPQLFIPRLLGLWQAGQFPFDRLVQTYPLDQIGAAEADSLSGKTIKPVLRPAPR